MFEPPIVTVGGLAWEPAAHGPEPEAVLMARARINGVPLALHAFRTAMPHASGWTDRIAWEDDKGILGTGILWRNDLTREHIRALDAGISSIILEQTTLEEDEREWEGRWLMLSSLLDYGDGGEWMPASIRGNRYHIVGTPVSSNWQGDGIPDWSVGRQHLRGGDNPGTPSISMRIDGGACDLRLLRVRALGGRMQGASPALHTRLGSVLPIIGLLGGHPRPMTMDDHQWLPLLTPSRLDEWSMDKAKILADLSRGLLAGQARWFLSMSSKRFDAFDSRVMESLADSCRKRTLALKEGRIWTSQSMMDTLGKLSFGRDGEETRSRVFKTMSKTLLRGVRVDSSGTPHLMHARVADRVYLFDDSLLAQIGEEFACLASQSPVDRLLRLPWETCVLDGVLPSSGGMPEWAQCLPALLDSRIERFLADWNE